MKPVIRTLEGGFEEGQQCKGKVPVPDLFFFVPRIVLFNSRDSKLIDAALARFFKVDVIKTPGAQAEALVERFCSHLGKAIRFIDGP